jgi:hypothetical protein
MTQEALKLALEALEANDKLINGSGTSGGLVYCMDGYYSDCFDVDPINKQIDEAVAAIKEALAQPERTALQIKKTDPFESARIGDYNRGWNDCLFASGIVKQPQRTEQEPVAKYSDIVSDGGLDPRNTIPPQRTWVGLTDDDTFEIGERLGLADVAWVDLMQAIESKLKQKNGYADSD